MKIRGNTRLLALLLALALACCVACSDDDDPAGPGGGGNDAPEFVGVDDGVDVPQGLEDSGDPHAQMVTGFVTQLNAMTGFAAVFDPPAQKAAEKDGPPWTYTWTFGEGTDVVVATLVVDETEDSYTWELRWDGTVDGTVFDDVLIYRAAAAQDGSWGDLWIYDLENGTGDVVFEWHWALDGSGGGDWTMISWEDTPEKIELSVAADGSGSLDFYEWADPPGDWELVYAFTWDAAGDGTWAEYEGGVMTASGSWSSTGGGAPDFGGSYEAPTTPQGMQDSGDPMASLGVTYVNMVGALGSHFTWFQPPEDKAAEKDGPPWTYTWTYQEGADDITVTLIVDETATMYTWDVYYDGTSGGETLVDQHVYHAWEYKDGSGGGVEFYDFDDQLLFSWTWTVGETSIVYSMVGYESGVAGMEIIVTTYVAGGGQVENYQDGTADGDGWLAQWIAWDAAGNGQWETYDEEGAVTDSGSWTAPV